MGARHSVPRGSNELEFLAEFQALRALQINLEVGLGGIAVRACAALRGEVHAIPTSEAQVEARGFFPEP
jgi:hypothetical protein